MLCCLDWRDDARCERLLPYSNQCMVRADTNKAPLSFRPPLVLQARDMMSYAQFLAGMAFNSASLGERSSCVPECTTTLSHAPTAPQLELAHTGHNKQPFSLLIKEAGCASSQPAPRFSGTNHRPSAGYVHAMAHQLGGFYDLPHGELLVMMLHALPNG